MDDNRLSIEQINKLDAETFHLLYRQYYKALVSYAFQLVGEMAIAEDVVQEFFSGLWEKKRVFLSLLSFKAYLFNSVRNASLDYLRHKDIESGYMQKIADEYQEQRLREDEDNAFFSEEVYRQLLQTIDALPERCKKVFLLAMEGKKNEEIAAALQVSLETVKTQKKRGMAFLRRNLNGWELKIVMTLLFS